MTYPRALVSWLDAHSPAATDVFDATDLNSIHTAMPITSSGWILRDDVWGISIASEHCGGTSYRGLTCIPRGMIVEVIHDKATKPRRRKSPSPTTLDVKSL